MNDSTRYSVWNALVDIIAAPGKALDEARRHVPWLWAPLLINIVLAVAVFVFYFTWVDFDWMVEEVIRQSVPPGGDPAVAAQIRNFMTPTIQIIGASVGVVVMTFVIYAIQAAYLHLVNKVGGDPSLRYGQWFAFSAWTSFPTVVQTLAMIVMIVLADDNRLAQHELMPLSFQSLFIHAEPGSSWMAWGNAISLINLWIIGLMIYGFMRWTGSSLAKAALLVSLPWLLVYGLWALAISL